MRFEGIYTPIVTPYRRDDSIDRDRFAEIADHLIAAGVHGLVLAATTGEYYAQTPEERVSLMRLAKDVVGGRVPLIVGTGAIRTEESVAYAEQAGEIGADGIMISTPPYPAPTSKENAEHALSIDRAVGLPILLCDDSWGTGVSMDETYLDAISQSANFCAIKESSGDMNRVHRLANGYPNIQLSCGVDDLALEFFAWGARSWVCAGSNFAPDAHIALYRACALDANFDKGRRIMAAMLPLISVLEQGGKFVQSIKHGLALRGFAPGPPRRPLQPMDEGDQQALAETIKRMDVEIRRIEAGA